MEGILYFYCPILEKRVKVVSELSQTKGQSFNLSGKKGFCTVNCGACSGNCVGCNLL